MKYLYAIALFGILLTGCEPEIEIAGKTTYTQQPTPAELFRANASAFVIGDTAYVVFGRNERLYNQLWQYDLTSATWKQKNDFPGKARVGAISITVADRVFAGLGYSGTTELELYSDTTYLRDFWEYHPATDRWSKRADYPGYGTNKASVVTINEELYVFHGFTQKGSNREVWKYSPSSDTWSRMNDFPKRHRYCTVAVSNGQRVFAGTGFNTLNNNEWWEYIVANDSWQQRKSMPDTGRCNAISFVVNNRIFVATGRYYDGNLTGGHLKNDILEYLPETDSWKKHSDLTASPRENAISFVVGNQVFIGFGEDNSTIFNDLWSFTPEMY